MLLFGFGQAQVEKARLGVVVREAGRTQAGAHRFQPAPLRYALEAAVAARGSLAREVGAEGIGLVVRAAVYLLAEEAPALVIAHRDERPVDGQLVEVGRAKAVALGVHVGEGAALQERVVREVDARHEVGGAEGGLFGFGKEVVGVTVERHFAYNAHGNERLGDELCRVEYIEAEGVLVLLLDELYAELVFGVVARFDGLPEVAAMEVGVAPGDELGLVPEERSLAIERLPVEAHEAGFAFFVHHAEGVDAEAFHGAVRARYAPVAHGPHHVMQGLGLERHVIPEAVVGALALRHGVVGFGLHGVDEIREFQRVLDEEHGRVVAHEVEVALAGVELHGEAADVAYGVGRAEGALHGGEAHEDRGLHGRVAEEGGLGELRAGLVHLEVAVRARAARVHHAFRDAFAVEVAQLVDEMEVLQKERAGRAGAQGVLVVRHFHAGGGGERHVPGAGAAAVHVARFVAGVVGRFQRAGEHGFRSGRRVALRGAGGVRRGEAGKVRPCGIGVRQGRGGGLAARFVFAGGGVGPAGAGRVFGRVFGHDTSRVSQPPAGSLRLFCEGSVPGVRRKLFFRRARRHGRGGVSVL